jgi:PAS domain S-box-containing protein
MASSALERLEVLEDLRESERQHRTTLEFLSDWIIVVDADRKVVMANRVFREMLEALGLDPGIVGLQVEEAFPFLPRSVIDDLDRVLATGKVSVADESAEVGPRRFAMETHKIPIIEDGEVARVVIVIHDLTQRLEAVEALRRSEETTRALLDGFRDVAFLTDAEGKIIVCNEALAATFGLSVDGLAGKRIFDILPAEIAEKRRRMHDDVIKRGSSEVYRFEDTFRGRTFANAVYPILGDGENRYAIFVREVTEQRRMEQELLRAQKIESLGVLAGGIAHDFNNILSSIMGNISLARMSLEGQDEVLELLTESEVACQRASSLTRQLLTFSSGGEPITKRTSIEKLVRESAGFALRGSNVKVEFEVDDDLWSVQVDRGQISQAVSNLVINADQAMPRGGLLRIEIRNRLLEEPNALGMPPGGYVEVAIRDQGTGISLDNLPLVFDPYFTTKQKGSGLGLSSAYSIVKRHGGVLTVESAEGEGATFHIYLRASREEPERPSAEPGRIRKGRGRILVMDDEEPIRMVTGRMLEKLGYEPAHASDGTEALAMYSDALDGDRRFDAVIMDLTVPGGMGGKEAVHKLLELDPDARVIVSSGYSNDPVMAEYRKHGFRGVVTKPVRVDALSEALEEALD